MIKFNRHLGWNNASDATNYTWQFLNETLFNWTSHAVTIYEKTPMPWYQNPWVGVAVGLVALAIFWTPSILRILRKSEVKPE